MEQQYGGKMEINKKQAVIPSRLRIGLPVLITADIGLLIAAHVCICSSTVVDGHAPIGLLQPHHILDDTLWSAVGRLLQSHAWCMVFIVAVLSGIVPYIKLVTTFLGFFFVDMGWVSKSQCCSCFSALQIVGKFGFADVFMIWMDFVLFHVYTGNHMFFFSVFNVKVHLWVQLHFGVIALIIAISVSALITQWAAFELGSPTPLGMEEIPLHDGPATREVSESSSNIVPGTFSAPFQNRVIVVLAAMGSLMFIIIGSTLPIISVDRDGLIVKLIRPAEDRHMNVSVMSMVSMMSSSAASLEQEIAVRFFVMCVFILVFIAPLLELALLIASAATSRVNIKFVYWSRICAEWFSSFDSIEVLVLVAFVQQAELDNVIQFNIQKECEPSKLLMNNHYFMTIAGLGSATDSRCFVLKSHLQLGFYVMLLTAMLRTIAWHFTDVLDGKLSDPLKKDVDA